MSVNNHWKRIRSFKLFWPLVILGLVLLFDLLFTPNFFKLEIKDGHLFGNLVDVLKQGAPLMLIAMGMTLPVATKGVDISVGPVAAIAGATAAYLIGGDSTPQTPMLVALLAALGMAALCGLWNGLLIARLGIQPIIATLILMVAGRGIAQMITQGQILTIYYPPFYQIGNGYVLFLPIPIFIVALIFVLLAALTRRSAFGMFVEAIGVNASASRYAGVDEKSVKLLCYIISAVCAGVAGLIICSNIKGADANQTGLLIEMDAILSVVIGGTSMAGGRFSLTGSLLGALIIQALTTSIYAVGIPPDVVQVFKAVFIFFICLIQSAQFRAMLSGLFQRQARQEPSA